MKRFSRFVRWQNLAICLAIIALITVLRIAGNELDLSVPDRLQDFTTFTASILIESLPFVILGVLLSIIVRLWIPADALSRWLPTNDILRRLYISCFGVFLPVCECGNLPLARGLVARGFTPAESLTFLLAAPVLNPITLITTHQAFPGDMRILVARAAGALLIANFIGWLFSRHPDQQSMLTPTFIAACQKQDDHSHSKHRRSLRLFNKELRILLPALFAGAIIAGAVQVLVPREILLGIGSNPLLSIGVMMVLAFIIAICSNVDAFFALAFSSTFSAGSIVAFLVFGPMIDIKMLSLMRTTYTATTLLRVTALVALLSMAIGLGVHYAL